MTIDYTKTPGRALGVMPAGEVPDEYREDYERALQQIARYAPESDPVGDARARVDGKGYSVVYWEGFTHAPDLFCALWAVGRAIQKHQGAPGGYRLVDHEMIDMVLGFDSGYLAFHGGHTANAISAGVRIEALEAMADGREEDLTDDERHQVEFIRAVRDLKMTDDIWNRMVERLGSVRAAIEFAYFVCYLRFHQQMMWVLGMPSLSLDDWRRLLQEYKDGSRDPAAETGAYVWEALERGRLAGAAAAE